MAGNSFYETLPQDPFSIPLLQIKPGVSEEVQCSLSTFSLNHAPQYEALSYVGGPLDPPDHVLCNDKRLQIRPNLGLALRRIRRIDKSRYIWVDALCINQRDDDELAQLVTRMRDVYSGATKVLIWLGQDNRNTAKVALALIRKAAGLARTEAGSPVPRSSQIASGLPSLSQNSLRGFPAVDDIA